ncbi:NAD(P)-dependent oxidoreductase [Euzebya tangerina]|uniref:NAD(P)-dependent oxidoreductase n=1 Tax=Euzebya tangerina TaxID=591198 RepID=UPI0013C2BC17|nr:NAD(P)-dependent oxidoreductase [Euzebya tangerina]
MSAVAVIGLGAMGTIMARNAAAAGHDVRVWTRNQQRLPDVAEAVGATAIPSPADAASGAEVVIVMVSDDAASRAVWTGEHAVLRALSPAAVAIDASTLSPTWSSALAQAATEASRPMLVAPVIGSTPQATAGELVQLVGGDAAVLDRVRAVLETSASRILHVGRAEDAAHRKLMVNGWLAGQTALAAELLRHLRSTGVALEDAASFLSGLPLTSPVLEGVITRMAAGDDEPRFPIRLVAKDAGYLAEAAGQRPYLDALAQAWKMAADQAGDRDLVGYLQTIEG